MSISIYTSEKVMPYVYYGIHKTTNQFYIGYRSKNVKLNCPSNLDLGNNYFTSSKKIKSKFNEFTWIIVAEFFNRKDAHIFEQQLIAEHISNPKCLNEYYNGKFYCDWNGRTHKESSKKLMSEARKGRTKETDISVAIMAEKLTGRTKEEYDYLAKAAEKKKGRTKENNENVKIRAEKMRGRTKENNEGVAKMAATLTGRTKNNNTSIALMAEKLTGRTKEKYEYLQKHSEKMRGRTKENNEGVAKMAATLTGRTKETHDGVLRMAANNCKLKPIHKKIIINLINIKSINEIVSQLTELGVKKLSEKHIIEFYNRYINGNDIAQLAKLI